MTSTYVLGAGVSTTAGLPLAADILAAVAQATLGKKDRKELDAFLEYVSPVFSTEYENYPDIEQFLTMLDVAEDFTRMRGRAQRLMFPRRRLSKLKRNFLLAMAKLLWEGHKRIDEEHCMVKFGKRLAAGDSVITFNYDLTMEHALNEAGSDWDYEPSPKRVTLLKPHGSVDWFWSDDQEADRENFSTLYDDLTLFKGWDFDQDALANKMPVIVPPVAAKTVELADLQRIWQWATTALSRADKLFIIGYSLPEQDKLTEFVLRRTAGMRIKSKKSPPCVVNMDGALRSRFHERIAPDVKFIPWKFERWVSSAGQEESAAAS